MPSRPPSHKTKPQVCYLCGTTEQMTREHVIPKSLFVRPYPNNLITLPACRDCNGSFAPDDEYFRDCMAMIVDEDPRLRELWEASYRGIKRNRNRQRDIMSRMGNIQIPRLDGTLGIPVETDAERISRVLTRMVKGLYQYHMKVPFPQDAKIDDRCPRVAQYHFLDSMNDFWRQCAHNQIQGVSYLWATQDTDPRVSIWYFCFYDKYFAAMITKPATP